MPVSPYGPISQTPQPPGERGTGANGETWDPNGGPNGEGAWIPQRAGDPAPRPAGEYGNTPTRPDGTPMYSEGEAPTQGGAPNQYGDPTPGRVRGGNAANGSNVGGAWGGYTGTNVIGPDGKVVYDESLSGRQADVDRMRGLGDKAANAQAFQLNYGNANKDAAMDSQDRLRQGRALELSRQAAIGQNSVAQALGRKTLAEGAQAQQAAAASTRGGPLATAAAQNAQAGGVAAYMQRGRLGLAASRADEMEAGRNQYMGAATAQRAGDLSAQDANQRQSINQGHMENAQRDINQQGELNYEAQAQRVNKSAQNAAIDAASEAAGVGQQRQREDNAESAANQAMVMSGSSNAVDAYSSGTKDDRLSDRRAKSIASFYGKGH